MGKEQDKTLKIRYMEKIKVLLVDDDLDFGNTAVLLLKKAG